MNKEKENELALAELGDKLMQEKLELKEELKIIDMKIKILDKKIQKQGKEKANPNFFFMKFIAQNRGYRVMKRLEEIEKENKK